MRLLKVIILIHVVGLIVFNLAGLLRTDWYMAYFLWDKIVGAGWLVWLSIYYSVSYANKWSIRPILVVSVIRFIWLIIAILTGVDVNHQWWLALFFILLAGAAGYLTLKEDARANKWLSKHMNI
jgi:hypothetical protein